MCGVPFVNSEQLKAIEKPAVKVFVMNDCDWVAATTLEEAKDYYLGLCGHENPTPEQRKQDEDEYLDEPCELDAEQMARLRFKQEDGTTCSFQEELDRLIAVGDEQFPTHFASTEC